MRKLLTVVAVAAMFVAGTTVPIVGAQPPGGGDPGNQRAQRPQASSVDRNGDHIDDALRESLRQARPRDQFEVIVTYRGGRAPVKRARRAVGQFKTLSRFTIVPGFAGTLTKSQILRLSRARGVFRIEPNSLVTTTIDDADDDFGTARARVDYGVDGSGVGICVIDTGVDPNHEQLDNGKVVGFVDYVNNQSNPYDDHGHGTHVANIAAGDGAGPSGSAGSYGGVAPGADIYAAKVLNSAGGGLESDVVLGIQWCAQQPGVDILNLSLGVAEGSDGADAMAQAVNNAVLNNQKTVAVAAGNSGDGSNTVLSPGSAAQAVTVGAAYKLSVAGGGALAGFSSRGPTAAGLTKPDVAAPGVAITAAQANNATGYTTFSGTSMATPFVAGTMALALQANPGLSPQQLKSLVMGTAHDRGEPGHDVHWGAGLLDGLGVVSSAVGQATSMAYAQHQSGSGSVSPNGTYSYPVNLGPADLSTPIGITILIDGQAECVTFFGACLGIYEWSPDLDARLLAPNGSVIATSTCPGGTSTHCGTLYVTQGQQETLAAMPTIAGTYTMQVTAASEGGSFSFDISAGAPSGGPPPTSPPIADAGADVTVMDADDNGSEPVSLDGSGSSDPDGGSIVTYSWSAPGVAIPNGATPTASFPVGDTTVTLTVTDDEGEQDTDTVIVTVNSPPPAPLPPVADAGPDQSEVDADDNGVHAITLDGTGSFDPDGGAIVTYSWSAPGVAIGGGPNPTANFPVGTTTVSLTVTDDENQTSAVDTVDITVTAPVNQPPVANAGEDIFEFAAPSGFASATLDGSASSDIDGNIVSYEWSAPGVAIPDGVSPTASFPVGTTTVTLTVIDDDGASATDTVDVMVLDIQVDSTHVHDLDGSSERAPRNRWSATVSVFVVGDFSEASGSPVGVDPTTIVFSLSTGGQLQCTTIDGTGQDGRCSVTSGLFSRKNVRSITFTVVSVSTEGFSYDAANNHDDDGDSDGTTITVQRP